MAAQSQILGRVLTRVVYFNLPDADWQRTTAMHRLDFGLDLEFGDLVVGVTWDVPGQSLGIRMRSLAAEVLDPVTLDATTLAPWRDAVGREVSDVIEREPQSGWTAAGQPCHWSVAIEFRGASTIWLAAASYIEPPGVLLPCSDELIVIGGVEVATRLGLA